MLLHVLPIPHHANRLSPITSTTRHAQCEVGSDWVRTNKIIRYVCRITSSLSPHHVCLCLFPILKSRIYGIPSLRVRQGIVRSTECALIVRNHRYRKSYSAPRVREQEARVNILLCPLHLIRLLESNKHTGCNATAKGQGVSILNIA
jgi:hypothetical protein